VELVDIWHVLAQSGFSFGVAAFLLMRLERELRNLTTAIQDLRACQVCKYNERFRVAETKAVKKGEV